MKEQLKKAKAIIEGYDGPPVRVMEVCGTHTHEIFHLGVRKILPQQVELISGPGCPVCVTPADFIDEAVWLALEKNVTICTFGDLVRVPGSTKSLADARSLGGKIQMVYSPMDAFEYAKEHKEEQVVFLSVGFETTTPASCLSVKMAKEAGLTNYALLTANKTMPGAYEMLKNSADVFLYPGHVNAITGNALNKKLCEEEGISGIVTGFTASEILTAFAVLLKKFPEGKPFFVNAYPRVVTEEGSIPAAVVGILFDDQINAFFYNYRAVSVALILFGILFIVIENRNQTKKARVTGIAQITYRDAMLIGLFQLIAAIFPGTSRSGATILGGILIGLSRTTAAEFTFFLAVPVMAGASLLKIVKFGLLFSASEMMILLVGMAVSFVVSVLVIKLLMNYIRKHDFKIFGWYRIVLGILVILFFTIR